jgi:4'-phosphopantetheinyl transferase
MNPGVGERLEPQRSAMRWEPHAGSNIPSKLNLEEGELDIWLVSLDAFSPSKHKFWGYLDLLERSRVKVFPEREAARFIVGRALLRDLLGSYLGLAPKSIEFVQGKNGKLKLAEGLGHPPLKFCLAHCRGSAIFAFVLSREVGVDIERVSPNIDELDLSRRYFSSGEFANLKSLPPKARLERFYQTWTLKEAVLKAAGSGLNVALDRIDTACFGSQRPMMSKCYFSNRRWYLVPLNLPRPMVGGLALEVTGPTLKNLRLRIRKVKQVT